MTIEWVCNNEKCNFRKKKKEPVTKSLANHEPQPTCACKTKMDRVTPLPTFAGLAELVAKELGTAYPASYQKKVIEFLKTTAFTAFQADFIDEMQKPTELGKFTKNVPARATSKYTVCFDNAMAEAGFALPEGCPVGEKFNFEIPFIMSTMEWKHMDFCKALPTVFTKKFLDFLGEVQGGYSYMLATQPNASSPIGHMIFIYVDDDKSEGWLHDPQMLKMPYKDHVCEAWESPYATGGKQKPGCTVNLQTGVIGTFEQ
jgi:hypothetical protein